MATDEILSKYRQMFTPHPMPRVPRDLKDKRPAAPLLFSTASYEAREQFETYRSHVSSFLQVQPPQHARPADGFLAELLNVNLGKLILVSGHIAASTKLSLPRSARRSPVDHWWLTRARSGETWLEAGDRRIHARPGDIYLFSPDQDFRSRTTDYDILSLILPRAAFAPVADTLDRLSGTILAGNLAALLGDHLTSLETRIAGMSPEEIAAAGQATLEMIIACVHPSRDRVQEAATAIEAALFERARAYIQVNLGNPALSPEHLMQALRVSRSNLYRAFERVGGVSRYIQLSRLLAARDALSVESERRVQEIAYDYGFPLSSDFTRAFRREFGMTPREMREQQRR